MKKLSILLKEIFEFIGLRKNDSLPNKSTENHYEELAHLSHHPVASIIKKKSNVSQ